MPKALPPPCARSCCFKGLGFASAFFGCMAVDLSDASATSGRAGAAKPAPPSDFPSPPRTGKMATVQGKMLYGGVLPPCRELVHITQPKEV